MSRSFISKIPFSESKVFDNMKARTPMSAFQIELTVRCNNNCRHCYINLPAQNKESFHKELSFNEIKTLVDEAYSLGALSCFITGGEPLLRDDFFDIYLYLKKKGLLVSIFTNATLITQEHIKLFKKYPPRDIEVTIYGVCPQTYERITRVPGSFKAFMHGLNLLQENGIKVRAKAMALRSNLKEFSQIALFGRKITKDYFRLDPFLHLRFDRDEIRNQEIKSERLTAEEIVALEKADFERFGAFKKRCDNLIYGTGFPKKFQALCAGHPSELPAGSTLGLITGRKSYRRSRFSSPELSKINYNRLFRCSTGYGSITISYDGFLKLCSSLNHPDCIYDLKKGTISEALQDFIPQVRNMHSVRKEFKEKCQQCLIFSLCMCCPALAYLETGELDKPVDYFCKVAHARVESFLSKNPCNLLCLIGNPQ